MDIFYLHYQRSLPNGTPVGWLIGCYSSLRHAEQAQARLESRPGYRDSPRGFSISCYRIDAEYDDPTWFNVWHDQDTRPNVWLGHLVEAVVGATSVLTQSKKRLEIHSSPQVVWARTDPKQFGTVVAQLIANAMEAVGENGRVRVTLDWHKLDKPRPRTHSSLPGDIPEGRYARLCVSDDGGGMAADVQAQIFEPHFSTKGAGRGMGLAQVYSLAGTNGWWLDVRSTEGTGTEMIVLLPVQ
jgi:signal transduction histidine kinase